MILRRRSYDEVCDLERTKPEEALIVANFAGAGYLVAELSNWSSCLYGH